MQFIAILFENHKVHQKYYHLTTEQLIVKGKVY